MPALGAALRFTMSWDDFMIRPAVPEARHHAAAYADGDMSRHEYAHCDPRFLRPVFRFFNEKRRPPIACALCR